MVNQVESIKLVGIAWNHLLKLQGRFALGFFLTGLEIGATALSITHDIESAKKIADKISMLHEGKIIWTGLSSELEKTNNKHVKQFIHGKTEGPIEINIT